jgi:hypothetical protein
MRDVRHAEHHLPAERGQRAQRRPRVAQVLEHIAAQHHVERRVRRELAATARVLDVADHDRLAVLARTLGGDPIGFDAGDATAAPRQLSGQVPGGAADVEHPHAVRHRIEQDPVRGRQAVLGHECRVRRRGPGLRLVVGRGQRSGS